MLAFIFTPILVGIIVLGKSKLSAAVLEF